MNPLHIDVFANLETMGFAGAIEHRRLFLWDTQRSNESGRGLHGLKSVAERMGATCLKPPFASEHYCILNDLRCADLPELVIAYLNAYWSLYFEQQSW